ncbi:MAG: GAF domain-containing protein [Chloroflexales bacterium]
MQMPEKPVIPLIGALLVAEGLLTQEQINATLLLQQQDYPDELLGEILIRCGYISRKALDRILHQQSELRDILVSRLESYVPQKVDLRALVLSHRPEHSLCRFLASRGVAVTVAPPPLPSVDASPLYDLLLIAADCSAVLYAGASAAATVGMLSPGTTDAALSPDAEALAARYVDQARVYGRLSKSLEQKRHSEFEMQTISTLIRSVTLAQTAQDALLKLMTIVRDLVSVEAGTLFRLDPSDQRLVFEVVLGPFQNELSQRRLSLDQGIAGWVARHGESLMFPDVRQDSRFEATFDQQTGFQTRSMLCVPLVALGQVRGVLQLINKTDGEFTKSDLSLLRITAAIGGMLLLFDSLASTSSPSWLGDVF